VQKTYKYEEMLPHELQEALDHMPLVVLPTGLLEWHGDHLPLGQDALKAYGICLELARKLGGGVVLPVQYWGRPGFSSYLGTLTFSEATLRALFLEIFGQIEKIGARVLLLVTGHYGSWQVDFVKAVAAEHNASGSSLKVIAQPEYEDVTVDGEQPSDHAGKWETSMFWHMYPELTHMENFQPGTMEVPQYENPPENVCGEKSSWKWWQDLREVASPELGARAVAAITDHLKELVLAELAQAGSTSQ